MTGAKLYNLADDIGETQDLAAALPDKRQELQMKWEAWNATLVPPLWGGGKADNDGPEPGTPNNRRGKDK